MCLIGCGVDSSSVDTNAKRHGGNTSQDLITSLTIKTNSDETLHTQAHLKPRQWTEALGDGSSGAGLSYILLKY